MKIISEIDLRNFEFWSGAKDNANQLTSEQLDDLEYMLDDMYPDGMTETQVNDLLWFDFEAVAEWLGLALDDNGDVIDPSDDYDDEDDDEEEEEYEEKRPLRRRFESRRREPIRRFSRR